MKTSIYFIIALRITSFLFIGFNCEDTPTGGEAPPPAKRDYSFRIVDTIYIGPYETITQCWGSSFDDIWIANYNAVTSRYFYRFDGEKAYSYDPGGFISCKSIHGFSANDIWGCGDDGTIYHYNGQQWYRMVRLYDNTYPLFIWTNVWGKSPDNIYTVGVTGDNLNRGIIAHYDGSVWTKIDVDADCQFQVIRGGYKEGERYFIQGVNRNYIPEKYEIFKYENDRLQKIFQASDTLGLRVNIRTIEGLVYFFIDDGIYKYENNYLYLIDKFSDPEYETVIKARSLTDMFVYMDYGIAHYNGIDIKPLLNISLADNFVRDVLLFEDKIFMVVQSMIDYTKGYTYVAD